MIKSFIKKSLSYNFSSLYTWGSQGLGTGFSEEEFNYKPQKLSQFDNKISKVAMGPLHSAVITQQGELYCFGSGSYGQLGNSNFSDSNQPQLVEFFSENRLKVQDVVCGKYQTLALTTDGQLWSWGYGGNKWTMQVGGLGCGKLGRQSTPQKVDIQKVVQITSGNQWSTILTENGDVYNFGSGYYGNFGDPFAKSIFMPLINENFRILKEEDGLIVKKIQSCSDYSVALMSDGKLYAMGYNMEGQCGTRPIVGQITDRELLTPTEVVFEHKIKDFALGENSMVILTDEQEVYYSGMEIVYKPIKMELPKKAIQVSACNNCIFVLTEDNCIYSNTEEQLSTLKFNFQANLWLSDKKDFDFKKIVKIGGSYNTSYAIVE